MPLTLFEDEKTYINRKLWEAWHITVGKNRDAMPSLPTTGPPQRIKVHGAIICTYEPDIR